MTVRTSGVVVVATALAGCGGKLPEQRGAVLEGFSYGWELFNHRLSQLTVQAGLDNTVVAVIGGTSTTSVVPGALPAECSPDECQEFPFTDNAAVEARWAVVDTQAVALVPLTVTLEAGREGASGTATGGLPEGAGGDAVAVVSGLSLSTDHALSAGPSCYDPAYGWHPQHLSITVGDVTVGDDGTVTVPVDASFAAGKTFEDERKCIDAVNTQAVVSLTIDLLAVVGAETIERQTLATEASYAFSGDKINPEAQDDPAPKALAFTVEDPVVGFTALDFAFDPDRTDDRGAYLRTLGWWAEPGGDANAVATNYSPGTQLSDFAYRFAGEVVAIDHGGTVTRGTSTGTFPAALEADGSAVPNTLPH